MPIDTIARVTIVTWK